MMNAVVQLIRNFLCCVKDLELFKGTILYDAKYFTAVHGLDYFPYHKTTPLEGLISICQFYVFVTGVPSAWSLFWTSLGKLGRIRRLLERKHRPLHHVAADAGATSQQKLSVEKLMLQSLVKEATTALKSAYVAFNCFFISIAFLWLSANSWHLTETPQVLGGLPALIHALTVMNICLTPLLYYMYTDAYAQFRRAKVLETAERHWQKVGRIVEKDLSLPLVEALTGWTPFWAAGIAPVVLYGRVSPQQEQEQWKQEGKALQKHLDDVTGKSLFQPLEEEKKKKSDEKKKEKKKEENELQALQLQDHVNEMAQKLHVSQRIARLEGYREFFFLIVNTIAWYGYGVCILVYYYPVEAEHPAWLRPILAYSQDNRLMDWRGNFMGDFMWTIEPLVILTSPLYLSSLQQTIIMSMKQRSIDTSRKAKEE